MKTHFSARESLMLVGIVLVLIGLAAYGIGWPSRIVAWAGRVIDGALILGGGFVLWRLRPGPSLPPTLDQPPNKRQELTRR
jgi:hypothetical protein